MGVEKRNASSAWRLFFTAGTPCHGAIIWPPDSRFPYYEIDAPARALVRSYNPDPRYADPVIERVVSARIELSVYPPELTYRAAIYFKTLNGSELLIGWTTSGANPRFSPRMPWGTATPNEDWTSVAIEFTPPALWACQSSPTVHSRTCGMCCRRGASCRSRERSAWRCAACCSAG